MPENNRDHLFISYAGEDGAFAEWLTLRLTSEGYRVWCDRIKLLGGESYPKDIDVAIKDQTFRMLAVLSRDSIDKPNPVKERTLGLNIARQRNEEFIIPLKLDGMQPAELNWMVSDITFVPFHQSWAEGLGKLLKLLDSINAPRTRPDGRSVVRDWVSSQDFTTTRQERLWTNVLDVKELPEILLRVNVKRGSLASAFDGWPHYRENDQVFWAFELPEGKIPRQADIRPIHWMETLGGSKLSLRNIRVNLLRQYLYLYCLRKGLKEAEADNGKRRVYFPPEATSEGWLPFTGYTGRKDWLRAVGERNFWIGSGQRETVRYHLSPSLSPHLDMFDNPVVSLRLQVYLTDTNGQRLPVRRSVRRRKAICKRWWNHAWLTRLLAVNQWLNEGKPEINLALTDKCKITILGALRVASVPLGIDEERLSPIQDAEETELIDIDEADEDEEGEADE